MPSASARHFCVFPVFVTGHHCGSPDTHRGGRVRFVFPVFVTGHHCGNAHDDTSRVLWNVFPVFVTGHHCGLSRKSIPSVQTMSSRSS